MNFETSCDLVKGLRPGMSRAEVDALAGPSQGILDSHRLSQEGASAWEVKEDRPCVVHCDDAGTVTQVSFLRGAGPFDWAGPDVSEADVLRRFPDHRQVENSAIARKVGFFTYELNDLDPECAVTCAFRDGAFNGVTLWTREALAKFEADHVAADRRRAAATEEAATRDAREAEERAKKEAERRALPPDERLLAWARQYSSWGGSSAPWVALAEFLIEDSTAEDRHLLAGAWNWDHGVEVLLWIAQQPDTARATVLQAFWLSEPTHEVMRMAKGEPVGDREEYELICEIGRNLSRKFYRKTFLKSDIAFAGRPSLTWAGGETEALRRAAQTVIPTEAFVPIRGREVGLRTHPWRFPVAPDEIR